MLDKVLFVSVCILVVESVVGVLLTSVCPCL